MKKTWELKRVDDRENVTSVPDDLRVNQHFTKPIFWNIPKEKYTYETKPFAYITENHTHIHVKCFDIHNIYTYTAENIFSNTQMKPNTHSVEAL